MEGNGIKTNQEVEATAFAGGIKLWMGLTDKRLEVMEKDIKKILAFQNKQIGVVAAVSALISLVVAFLR